MARAYYVDLASNEEERVIVEAQVDSLLGDLEVLFQEQLATLAEDAMKQHAIRKEKAVITEHANKFLPAARPFSHHGLIRVGDSTY